MRRHKVPLPVAMPNVELYSRDIWWVHFLSSSMAALYEGYTLCGRVSAQSLSDSGVQGIEVERDSDHVIVTDSSRSVTLYMVRLYVNVEGIFTCYSRAVELVSSVQKSPGPSRNTILHLNLLAPKTVHIYLCE